MTHPTPGDALRQAREAAGINQRQLAALLDIDYRNISAIELGKRGLPRRHLHKLPRPIAARVVEAMVDEFRQELMADIIPMNELEVEPR